MSYNWCCNDNWGGVFYSKEDLRSAIVAFPNDATYGRMNCWDVSRVTDMTGLFYGAASFNEPIECWDVSKVTNMYGLFYGASSFNQPLDSWDVSSVTDMRYMFSGATSFGFFGVTSFNQPLNSWDVRSVTDMSYMFSGATSFNQPLDSWDVRSVTDMRSMFSHAKSFNQPLDRWEVSMVAKMDFMFSVATSFNQTLCPWYNELCWNTTYFTHMFEKSSCPSTEAPDCNTMESFCGKCVKDLPALSPSYAPPTAQPKSGLIFGVISAVFVMVTTIVYFVKRRKNVTSRKKSSEEHENLDTEIGSQKSRGSQKEDFGISEATEHQKSTIEIELDPHSDDVSSICYQDDPTSNDLNSQYNPTDDITMAASIIKESDEYKMHITGDINPTISSTSVVDGEIRLTVNAPPGKLGLVIGANISGQIIIKGIKSGSAMSGIIQVGDFLKTVDRESTEGKTPEQVTQLVSSGANNPIRALELVRNAELVV